MAQLAADSPCPQPTPFREAIIARLYRLRAGPHVDGPLAPPPAADAGADGDDEGMCDGDDEDEEDAGDGGGDEDAGVLLSIDQVSQVRVRSMPPLVGVRYVGES